MFLAKAILVAGPNHAKYAAGTSLGAILFVNSRAVEEVETVASHELSALGWASMTIEGYKEVVDYGQFHNKDTAESGAFRDALQNGFGIVIYP